MRLLLVGPPGSGKGTQATVIGQHFGIAHISSGALLRREIADQTPTGRAAQEYVSRGDLVPDDIVIAIVREPVQTASRQGGYVLDGFPRTLAQAEAFDEVGEDARIEVVLCLDVPREALIERMLQRQHGRDDDTESVMRHRIDSFEKTTPPLLEHYASRAVVLRIDGDRPIDDVSTSIIAELERVPSAPG